MGATEASNLGNAQPSRVTEATRIPMSAPHQKLAVPPIPGYHQHWFLGKNVARALAAGYTHVTADDGIETMGTGVANSAEDAGSTDLGTNVSILAGEGLDEHGDSERLYLMKLPQEWREQDVANLEARNESIAAQLRGGGQQADGETAADRGKRYVKKGQDLFTPKSRK